MQIGKPLKGYAVMTNLMNLRFSSDTGNVCYGDGGELTLSVKVPPYFQGYSFIGAGDFKTDEFFVIDV